MIDYNEFLSVEEKINFLEKTIETEKEKLIKILSDNKDSDKRLGALEDYYVSVKEINDKYSKSVEKKDFENAD